MQNDDIFRDYYNAWDWLQARWAEAEPVLTSDQAIHYYAILSAIVVLTTSVWYASRLTIQLQGIAVAAFTYKRRGRKASKPESVERARKELIKFRKSMWKDYRRLAAVFVACGILIPTTGLFLVGSHFDWIEPGSRAFVNSTNGQIVDMPSQWDLFMFTLDQLTRGALMDFAEVFHIDLGHLSNNPTNYPFSIAIFLYRSFVGTFATAFLFFIWQAFLIVRRMPPADEVIKSAESEPNT